MLRHSLTLAIAVATGSSVAAQTFVPGRACVDRLHEFVAFKDPTSVVIEAGPIRAGADIVDWQGLRVEAILFDLHLRAKNSFGAYEGTHTYRCATAMDARRVLWIKPQPK